MNNGNGDKDYQYLWFLPLYLIAFVIVERVNIGAEYHTIHMFMDDLIPFSEFFVIPYLSWHVISVVMIIYLYRNDRPVFRKMMQFFIVGAIISFAVFLIYPSCHSLRPDSFEHDNIFTWIVSMIYLFDTPTNVCPSMHVIGSMGLMFAAMYANEKMSIQIKTAMAVTVFFICVSTLFVKQHSIVDAVVALPASFAAWGLSFNEASPEAGVKLREVMSRKNIINLPNAITLMRFLLIPVIVRLYLEGSYAESFAVIVVAVVSDLIDGAVARRTGCVTDFGKFFDSAVSKIMIAVLIICLVPKYRWMWLLLMAMMFRELCQIIYGYILFSRYDRVYSSKWFGKICKVSMISVTAILFLWQNVPRLAANLMIIACSATILLALLMYTRMYLKVVWGDEYTANISAVSRTLIISLWVIVMIVVLCLHDRISLSAILSYTPSDPYMAAAVMLLMFALKTLSVFFYSGILFLANGTLFSLPTAIAMNIAGALVMIFEGYFFGNKLAGEQMQDIEEKYPKLRGLVRLKNERPFLFVLLLRLFKVMNYDICSMYLGAAKVKLPQYVACSLLGLLPDIILYAMIGRGLGDLNMGRTAIAGIVYIGLSAASMVVIKLLIDKYGEETENRPPSPKA
ncbi:MAG: CDP-alcohol phosphatidyltransferase family protein [Mogibacterium sp.]|nr:CDP-alcohol phosphatidyltransferase family protein [Mogibacterium sp.]